MILATADICPHGTSSSLCEWCLVKATSENRLKIIFDLRAKLKAYKDAVETFENRRKLAYSLREETPHVAAFVEAIGLEMDKYLRIIRGEE